MVSVFRHANPARTAIVMGVVMAAIVYGVVVTSQTADWSPWWLVGLLLALCTAAEIVGSAGQPILHGLEVSGSSLATFCAFVLLGPAPAACIAAAAVAAEGLWRRKPADVIVTNVGNYAGFALVGGVLAGEAFRDSHLTATKVALGIGLYVLANAISFLLALGGQALRGVGRTRAYLSMYATCIPSEVVGGMLAVLAVWSYMTGSGIGLALLGVALVLLQFLVSRLTRVEFELRAQRDRAQAYLDAAGSPFVILDSDHRIETLNRRAEALLGSNEQLAGVAWSELLNADDRGAFRQAIEQATHGPARFECLVQARDGSQCAVLWSVVELASVEATGRLLLSGEDITDRRAAEHELHRLAMHDPLTGLPNRAAFRDALSRALTAARAHEHALAVVFIDLDEFKAVNDALGHAAGDALLCHVARRLERSVREHDVVARLSGDEFLVLLDELPRDAADARRLADDVMSRMLDDLHAPYAIDGREVTIGGSSGIALYPADGEDPETLLDLADREMYGRKSPTRLVLET